jgi:hypothetical protein
MFEGPRLEGLMTDYRTRYREARSVSRAGWAEWGPFLLALLAGAGLLLLLARHSPLFTVPQALPASGAIHQGDASGEHSGGKEPQGSPDLPE